MNLEITEKIINEMNLAGIEPKGVIVSKKFYKKLKKEFESRFDFRTIYGGKQRKQTLKVYNTIIFSSKQVKNEQIIVF